MAKILVFLSMICLLLTSSYAFDILNSNGESQTYFSITNDKVIVQSDTNTSNLNVQYYAAEQIQNKDYILEKCENKYCVQFKLTDLIQTYENTFSVSKEFTLTLDSQSKTIYLDIEPPTLNITSTTINTNTKEIDFTYEYSDNYNNIKKIELYTVENNNYKYIKDLIKTNSYKYPINESKTYNFLFKIYDIAGNYNEYEKNINAQDLFNPKILNTFLILENSNYKLSFNISDENLSKYEIIQSDIILTEDISGQKYQKIINLPFNSGNIILRITDKNNNQINKTISLKSPITITYKNKYSNSKTFEFKANANNCYLTQLDSESYANEQFSKNSNEFSKKLNINSIREYEVKYYCDTNDFRQYFTDKFYYDNKDPQESNLSLQELDNGNIRLSWSESEDEDSEITYILYKNDNKIYEGIKLRYEDTDVKYSKEYEYYLEVSDEAQNIVTSNKVVGTPKKVSIEFETELSDYTTTKKKELNFQITTDKNSDVTINVEDENGNVIDTKNYENIQDENLDINLNLKEGINKIKIKITDDMGNELDKTYFATLQTETLATLPVEKEEITQPQTKIIESAKKEKNQNITNTTNQNINTDNQTSNYDWIIFGIIIIILGYLGWYFIINEDKLRSKNTIASIIAQKNKKNNTKPTKFEDKKKQLSFMLDKRIKDKALEKDFKKIKKERKLKQIEKQKEIERKKQIKEKTKLENEKLKDLEQQKQKTDLSFTKSNYGEDFKKNIAKRRKETINEDPLKPLSHQTPQPKEEKRLFFFKKKESPHQDPFADYLNKVQSTPAWDNAKDYLHSEQQKKQEEIRKKQEEIKQKEEESLRLKEENIRREKNKIKKKQEEQETQLHVTQEKLESKKHLDDYIRRAINKRKKNNFYFIEKLVDRDISKRQ